MSGPCGVRGRRRKETNEGGVKLATFIFRNSLYPLCGKPTRIWKFVMRKELQQFGEDRQQYSTSNVTASFKKQIAV